MVQSIDRFILIQLLHWSAVPCGMPFHFLHEGLELPKLDEQWFVSQVLDVLGIVVCLVGCATLVYLLEALWLVRVDAFQNA